MEKKIETQTSRPEGKCYYQRLPELDNQGLICTVSFGLSGLLLTTLHL